jgi:anti-anti-sigma regulatory factor
MPPLRAEAGPRVQGPIQEPAPPADQAYSMDAQTAVAPGAPLELPPDLGIEQAAALHALLASRLDEAGPVTLAAGGVTRLHTAGLQVLAAFCATRAAAGRATVLDHPSAELRAAAARLALGPLLGLAAA